MNSCSRHWNPRCCPRRGRPVAHLQRADPRPDDAIADCPPQPLKNAVAYGKAVYQALFPAESPAHNTLMQSPDRILLVADDPPPPFVLELPPYRVPNVRSIWTMMWERTRGFIRKAGTIILASSIAICS